MNTGSKAHEIMIAAKKMIQTSGYNGFSFRDLSREIGIKSASIHYHFPTKGDLAVAVATAYREGFSETLLDLENGAATTQQALQKYAALFQKTLDTDQRICLCGMLASETESLPEKVRMETIRFFEEQEQWLAKMLSKGIIAGELPADTNVTASAKLILSTLEGAMIIVRNTGRRNDFSTVSDQLFTLISGPKI